MADSAVNASVAGMVMIFTTIIGVAMIAILISQRSRTAEVLGALASGTSQVLGTAISPVTGGGGGGSPGGGIF